MSKHISSVNVRIQNSAPRIYSVIDMSSFGESFHINHNLHLQCDGAFNSRQNLTQFDKIS